MEEQAVIYGVKTKDTIHYIGKKINGINAEGNINKSNVSYIYNNEKIRNIFRQFDNAKVVPIKTVPQGDWYNQKLLEVVEKHRDNHPLLNAQWMLDGKRGYWQDTQGYWQGKKRDAHTLQRLSESKYRKVVQYDISGNLVKVWDSGKEIGMKVFGDYKVVKGCGTTKLYLVIRASTLKGRLRHGSYWFAINELLEFFQGIPNKLNIDEIRREEKLRKTESCKNAKKTHMRRYTVILYNNYGEKIKTFANIYEAGQELKVSPITVGKICRGLYEAQNFKIKYGERTRQLINIEMPRYEIQPIVRKKNKKEKVRLSTRTRHTVVHYGRNKEVLNTFDSVGEAAQYFKIPESTVRRTCSEGSGRIKELPYGTYLKLGEKKKVVVDVIRPKEIKKFNISDEDWKEVML